MWNGFQTQRKQEENAFHHNQKQSTKKIVVWGIGEYHTDREDVTYINCSNENELLARLWILGQTLSRCNHWLEHRVFWYSFPYQSCDLGSWWRPTKEFSPWGIVNSRSVYNHGRQQQTYDIGGVANLDICTVSQVYIFRQESYRLDHIAFVELGEKKNENPYDTFKDWYTKDYQSFVDYNIVDVELVDRLEDKLNVATSIHYDYDERWTMKISLVRLSIGMLWYTTSSRRKRLLCHKSLTHQSLTSMKVRM